MFVRSSTKGSEGLNITRAHPTNFNVAHHKLKANIFHSDYLVTQQQSLFQYLFTKTSSTNKKKTEEKDIYNTADEIL